MLCLTFQSVSQSDSFTYNCIRCVFNFLWSFWVCLLNRAILGENNLRTLHLFFRLEHATTPTLLLLLFCDKELKIYFHKIHLLNGAIFKVHYNLLQVFLQRVSSRYTRETTPLEKWFRLNHFLLWEHFGPILQELCSIQQHQRIFLWSVPALRQELVTG